MSGGGSGGGGPFVDTPIGECQEIYKNISVLSADSDILDELSRGSNLDFSIEDNGALKSLLLMYNGEKFGSISKFAAQIIACIEEGRHYIAVVSSIDGGSCLIEARKVATDK